MGGRCSAEDGAVVDPKPFSHTDTVETSCSYSTHRNVPRTWYETFRASSSAVLLLDSQCATEKTPASLSLLTIMFLNCE